MKHTLYIGAVVAVAAAWGFGGVMFFGLPPAHGQAGPPGEVINQARKALAVTPSDTVDLALGPTRYLFDGQATACTIAVILADDTAAVTFSLPAAIANPYLPLRAKRVMAAGTTCTPIIGLW